MFWEVLESKDFDTSAPNKYNIEGLDTKEILENVLNKLPNPDTLDEVKFKVSMTTRQYSFRFLQGNYCAG